MKWSASKNERLCSATKLANRVSAMITRLAISWSFWLTKKEVTRSFSCETRSRLTMLSHGKWHRIYHPQQHILQWELHTWQNAFVTPLSLRHIHRSLETHVCWNLGEYFFFWRDSQDKPVLFLAPYCHADQCSQLIAGMLIYITWCHSMFRDHEIISIQLKYLLHVSGVSGN